MLYNTIAGELILCRCVSRRMVIDKLAVCILWYEPEVLTFERIFIFVPSFSILSYLLTYSLEQSPSLEPNWFSASQEIPRILWNLKFHYRIYKCPPPVPIPSQLDPVHTPISHFLKIHLNIILPSTSGTPKWSLSFRFPHKNPVYASPLPLYALHAPPISLFSILSPDSIFSIPTAIAQPYTMHRVSVVCYSAMCWV